MAVIKAKATKMVDFALATVAKQSILPYVTTRVSGDNFEGARGDTVTLKVKGLNDGYKAVARDYEWRTRNAPIVMDDITTGGPAMPFTMSTHSVSATPLTDEHYTLDNVAFATEVIQPQAQAIGDRFEAKALAAFGAIHPKDSIAAATTDDPYLVALEAKRLMDLRKTVPGAGRSFLVGTNVAAWMLSSDRLSRYDLNGLEGTPALRDAIIGRLVASPVIEVPDLDPDDAFYVHNQSIVLASMAPAVPNGAKVGHNVGNKQGFAVRWIADYDSNYLRDRSVCSAFFGWMEVRDERNPDGSWIYEETDYQTDEEFPLKADGTPVDRQPQGTRKNVRVIPITISGLGSVL